MARLASDIRLRQVMAAVGAESGLERCALGFPVCGDEQECALHPAWSALKRQLDALLDRTVDSWVADPVALPDSAARYDPQINDELL